VSTTSLLTDVAHVIQVAVAPVFLPSGIGTMLGVFIARLVRIVDRSRVLDDRLEVIADNRAPRSLAELMTLSLRSRLIERAIVLASAAGFFVCLVIVTLFVDFLFGFEGRRLFIVPTGGAISPFGVSSCWRIGNDSCSVPAAHRQ
jgi:hypothetical protein